MIDKWPLCGGSKAPPYKAIFFVNSLCISNQMKNKKYNGMNKYINLENKKYKQVKSIQQIRIILLGQCPAIVMESQSLQSTSSYYSFLTHPQITTNNNSLNSTTSSSNVMDTMTQAMKLYKNILFQIESQYRSLGGEASFKVSDSNKGIGNSIQSEHQIINNRFTANKTSTCNSSMNYYNYQKLQQMLAHLLKSATQIQEINQKKMLSNRLANRFLQITTLYRNKCAQSEATAEFKDHLSVILGLIREYQSGNFNSNLTNNNGNGYVYLYVGSSCLNTNYGNGYSIELVILFDRICWVFKKCLKQLREKAIKIFQRYQTQSQNSTNKNLNVVSNILMKVTPVKEKQKQKKQMLCVVQTPAKSLEYKYRITKEILSNTSLFVGMDVDVTHLRGLFYQYRNSTHDLEEEKMEANSLSIKCRDQYVVQYNEYKIKVKKKMEKKMAEKILKVSQSSPIKNRQNKTNMPQINNSVIFNKTSKMPKILQTTQLNLDYTNRNSREKERDKDCVQFRNIQALNFNRQFIHLNQIKNQKIAKRPYAEVKQVLVAGDELNYYSNKSNVGETNNCSHPKVPFFIQRATKNEKNFIRKRSVAQSNRIATQ